MNKKTLFSTVLVFLFLCAAFVSAQDKSNPSKPSFYCLYTWSSEFKGFKDDVAKVGFKWLRTGGPLDDSYDEGILEAAKYGIRCVPVIGGNDSDKKAPKMEAWKKTVKDFVLKYCEGGTLWKQNPSVPPLPVEYIEIWNEPNIEFLNPPEGMGRDKAYFDYLKTAYEIIKQLNPKIKVIGMNTSSLGCVWSNSEGGLNKDGEHQGLLGWFKFMKGVHKLGGGKYYDILGIHPYGDKSPDNKGNLIKSLDAMHEEMKTNGNGDKPIWITEVGWSLPGKDVKGKAFEGSAKDEDIQADYILKLYGISAAHGVEQI